MIESEVPEHRRAPRGLDTHAVPSPMWTPRPEDVATARITEFAEFAGTRTGRTFAGYDDLLRWSVGDLSAFWGCIWDFFEIIADRDGDVVLADDTMPGAVWFPGARLSYVEQVFRDRPDNGTALVELDEIGRQREL